MTTLGERLDRFRGIGPGFDHLRVGLSLAILVWHAFGLSEGLEWTRSLGAFPLPPLLAGMLPMFFALSGFLVMGSALRTHNLRIFLTFRVLRILPALFAEISLSALVLGPLLTTLPLDRYFGSSEFLEYFGSLVGRVRYTLPGLFLTNPLPRVVNGALWTVGPEILCYVIMALFMLTGIYRSRKGTLLASAAYLAACLIADLVSHPPIHEILPTRALIFGFLSGALLFHYRARIGYSVVGAGAALLGAVLLVALAQHSPIFYPAIYPAVFAFAYVVAVIGLTDLPPLPFFHRGDYSYGIYIYGFPIQQSIIHFFADHRNGWFVLALSVPMTLLFAVASWHVVEKPVLNLRRRLLPGGKASSAPDAGRAWGVRQWALASLLLVYGVFVADAARVFPLREARHWLLGGAVTPVETDRPQF